MKKCLLFTSHQIIIENGNEDCEEDGVSTVEPPVTPPGHEEPRVYLPSIPVPIEQPIDVSSYDNEDSGENDIDKGERTITITPNPAKDMVEVTYQVTANSDYQLSLVSIFGEQLQILEQGNTTTNEERQIRFDSSIYPLGVYIIVLTTDEGKEAKQLIIAK